MNEIEERKIKELKKILVKIYDNYMKQEDNYHKSSEGNIEIIYDFGNYFDNNYLKRKSQVTLEVYSYVFSDDGRRKVWEGDNLIRLLNKAITFFSKFLNDSVSAPGEKNG